MFARRVAAAAASGLCGPAAAWCNSAPSDTRSNLAAQNNFSARVQELKQKLGVEKVTAAPELVIVSPTFYPSVEDTRCQLGLQACRNAQVLGIPLILVDASPPKVRAALEEAGAIVRPQTRSGKKGAALRQAIEAAAEKLPPDGIICFQELEKVEMVRLSRQVAAHMHATQADICVPRREDVAFRRSYPLEQYHAEHFANAYLDSLSRGKGLPSLDWTFGPVALRASVAPIWIANTGELWDAQLVPFIQAVRWHGAKITTITVAYEHPVVMKHEEQGKPRWSEKRLEQLNFLFKFVGDALRTNAPPPTAPAA